MRRLDSTLAVIRRIVKILGALVRVVEIVIARIKLIGICVVRVPGILRIFVLKPVSAKRARSRRPIYAAPIFRTDLRVHENWHLCGKEKYENQCDEHESLAAHMESSIPPPFRANGCHYCPLVGQGNFVQYVIAALAPKGVVGPAQPRWLNPNDRGLIDIEF
jgi:hypothetical protein